MKTNLSRILIAAPAAALILIGVASIVLALGPNSGGAVPAGGHAGGPQPSRAPLSSGIPANPRFGLSATAPVVGTVASKTGTTIVVTTSARKTVTVDVTAATKYVVRGVAAATLANIAVGDRIAAQGSFNADGSLNATQIATGVGQPGRGRGFGGGGDGGFGGGRNGGFGGPSAAPSGPST